MIQPIELTLELPVLGSRGAVYSTTQLWEILEASHNGDLLRIQELEEECPELIYAQYNYAPPIHFAVREGHLELVRYLLDRGAHDPDYRFYPFLESMQTVAADRGHTEIVQALDQYETDPSRQVYSGDNGKILYNRTPLQQEFEKVVEGNDLARTRAILQEHPEFALDQTYFWNEGILMKPAKLNHREIMELLMSHGAKAPDILKWTQFYYFERYDGASFMMEKGMNPDTMSWQRVTILHDMAQKGMMDKAELLIRHGADINLVDEAYLSTPLGLAVRWGQMEMVEYLMRQGADINKSGAEWATPLAWAKRKGHTAIEAILRKAGAE